MAETRPSMRPHVIEADGWPGGPRVVVGKRPSQCIHKRPLRGAILKNEPTEPRPTLCQLCVYEVEHRELWE